MLIQLKRERESNMSNMSYCQFENTYNDLLDCYDSLVNDDTDDMSVYEEQAKQDLVKLCKDIAREF